jgi:DnaK suppressor protein
MRDIIQADRRSANIRRAHSGRTAFRIDEKQLDSKRPRKAINKLSPLDGNSRTTEAPRSERARPLSRPTLERQRQALLALLSRLRGQISSTVNAALTSSIEATSASPDTADLAVETVDQDMALSFLSSADGTVDQIEASLRRIDDGSYGRCVRCNMKIPSARLEAIPYAVCCVECAARQERVA